MKNTETFISPYIYVGLQQSHPKKTREATIINEITDIVCKHYNVRFEDVDIESRRREIVEIRKAIMYWHRECSRATFVSIGQVFKRGYDHTSIIFGIESYKDLLLYDKNIQRIHKLIEAEINRKIL